MQGRLWELQQMLQQILQRMQQILQRILQKMPRKMLQQMLLLSWQLLAFPALRWCCPPRLQARALAQAPPPGAEKCSLLLPARFVPARRARSPFLSGRRAPPPPPGPARWGHWVPFVEEFLAH